MSEWPVAALPAAQAVGSGSSAHAEGQLRSVRWALLFGNFSIGCGVMVTAGTLNDLSRSLQVSVAVSGQLITAAAVVIALCAPPLAAVVAGIDRRRLLAGSLLWFGFWHGVSALMPN